MKKRMKKMAMLMMALALSLTVAMPVKAEKRSWEFNKPVTESKEYFVLVRASKADDEKTWYVTTKETKYSNISKTNSLQCKVKNPKGEFASDVMEFKSYTAKHAAYIKPVHKGDKNKLLGRKNPSSTTKGNLVVWGLYTP